MTEHKTVARRISEYLEASGDRYDLSNSLSIKVLAIDLQDVLAIGEHQEGK